MTFETLKSCCFLLNSEKITERKKAAEQIKHLLNNENLVSALNHSSKVKNGNHFNWDQVFYYAKCYFIKEAEKLAKEEQKKEESSTKTNRTSWKNQKYMIAGIPKLILQRASKTSTAFVSCPTILEFVMNILNRHKPYLLENFAFLAIQILHSFIFGQPIYYLNVPLESWKDILRMCIWIYNNKIVRTDLVILLSVIECIVKGFRTFKNEQEISPSVFFKELPNFLCCVAEDLKNTLSYGAQTNYLSLMNTCCNAFGSQWRRAMCKVGENTIASVLNLWEMRQTDRQLLLYQYLYTQLTMHCPQKGGYYNEDWELTSSAWTNAMKRMYILLNDMLSEISQTARHALSSSVKDIVSVPNDLIIFAARLFSKIYSSDDGVFSLDVSQAGPSQNPNLTSYSTQSTKKRRIEINFQSLCDFLKEELDIGKLPWFNILEHMLQYHSSVFRDTRKTKLLDVLQYLLSSSVDSSMIDCVLRCLKNLCIVWKLNLDEDNGEIWKSIVDKTLRLMGGSQCVASGAELLQKIVQMDLVPFDGLTFKIFRTNSVCNCKEGLGLLQNLLQTCQIPKTLENDCFYVKHESIVDSRMQLLTYLIPMDDSAVSINFSRDLSEVLLLLCSNEPMQMKGHLKAVETGSSRKTLTLEEIYLKSSFCNDAGFLFKKSEENEHFNEIKINRTFEDYVVDYLLGYTGKRNLCVEKTSIENFKYALNICYLAVYLSPFFESRRLRNLFKLQRYFVDTLQKLTEEHESTKWTNMEQILSDLAVFYRHCLLALKKCRTRNQNFPDILNNIPLEIIKISLGLFKLRQTSGEDSSKPSGANSDVSNSFVVGQSKSSFIFDSDDDMDLLEVTDIGPPKDVFDSSDSPDWYLEIAKDKKTSLTFSSPTLSSKDACLLKAASLICAVEDFSHQISKEKNGDESDLLAVIDIFEKYAGSSELEDIALVFPFLSELFALTYQEENVDDGIAMLSKISGKHGDDPRVAAQVLIQIKDLLTLNGLNLVPTQKINLIHITKTFARKIKNYSYGFNVKRILYQVNFELIKLDPLKEWSTYRLETDRMGTSSSDIYELLKSPYQDIRILATDYLPSLLIRQNGEFLPIDYQLKEFEKIYQTAMESLTLQGQQSPHFLPDEENGRIIGFLLTLVNVAVASPFLECYSVYALFSAIKTYNVNKQLTKAAMCRIALARDMNVTSLLEEHLLFVVSQWIHDKHNLTEFPFEILNFDSFPSFIDRYSSVVVLAIFNKNQQSQLDSIAAILGVSNAHLIQSNFASIFASFLPYLVLSDSTSRDIPKSKSKTSVSQFKYLETNLGRELMTSLLEANLGHVTLALLNFSHDGKSWTESELVFPPNQFYYESSIVEDTLNSFHKSFFENEYIVTLLAKQQSSLHVVIHGLFASMSQANSDFKYRWTLARIDVFVKILLPHFGHGLGQMSAYVINRLTLIMTAFTSKMYQSSKYLAVKCNEILLVFLKSAMESNPKYVSVLLKTIISRLLRFIGDDVVWRSAANILSYLMTSKSQEILSALSLFPPFPDENDQMLQKIKMKHSEIISEYGGATYLTKYVEKFLEVSNFDNNEYYLKFLLCKLKELRSEMFELYETTLPSGQKLSHAVIHRLINILCFSDDKEIKQIVSDCLGEFGPRDLEVDVFNLNFFTNNQLDSFDKRTTNIYAQVIMWLYRMTYSVDVKDVEAAINSMKSALNTKVGRESVKEMDEIIKLELLPFISNTKVTKLQTTQMFEDICCESLWTVEDFDEWVINLTSKLLKAGVGCDFFHSLLETCQISASFCENIFPYVLFYSLKYDLDSRRSELSKCVQFIIKEELKKKNSDRSLRLIVKSINYLRVQDVKKSFSGRKSTHKWERNFWLDLEFSDVAEAAFRIGSHFSAILFAELSCEVIENGLNCNREYPGNEELERRKLSPLQRISAGENGIDISNFLLKIYNDLGDSIGIEGCSGSNSYVSGSVQVALSRHSKDYMNAIALCDSACDAEAYADTLRDAGLFKILGSLVPPSPQKSDRFLEAQAECAWRLSKWNEGSEYDISKLNPSSHFNQVFLTSLTELKNQNMDKVDEAIKLAKLVTINDIDLKESTHSLYPYLTQLKMMSEFKEIGDCFFRKSNIPDMDNFLNLATFFELHDPLEGMSFKFSEKILSSRISTLKVVHTYVKDNYVQNVLFNTLIKKCQLCRSSKSGNVISQWKSALTDGESLDLDNVQKCRIQLETAHFFSAVGSPRQSINVLEKISHKIGSQANCSLEEQKLLSKALTLNGKILMETRVKSPQSIVNDYLLKAIKLEEDFNGNTIGAEDLESSYYQLGKYGDCLYQEITGYLTSDQCKDRRNQIEKSKEEAEKVAVLCNSKSTGQPQEEKRIHKKFILLQKEISRETKNLAQREEEASLYLNIALQNYLKSLISLPRANLVVFRIISLWFENLKEAAVNDMIRNYTKKIKTHQFLPLVYQLVARLTNIADDAKHHASFPETLSSFLERICIEHPYHSLHVVMMLANSYLDDEINNQEGSFYSRTVPKKRGKSSQKIIEEDRILAAKELIRKLKGTCLNEHIKELEGVCYAYVHFVNTTPKPNKQSQVMAKVQMKKQIIANLKNLKYVAPLSRPIAIQPSSNYSPPTITKWDPVFNFCGGINAPVRLTVHASDGLHTMELLKGDDDLRQDAVLEQVFTVMNNLMKKDFEAKKQRISIRTYMVVPFSQMSGLIQWCNNTRPIGDILIDAHDRFYPDQWSALKCRKKMAEVAKQHPDQKFTNFQDILMNFPPAFRFFFFEHYSKPDEWFSQRQAYVRSVATSSIAGYIIGLGDRHVQNLLFDVSTAEVIHIDLGIAFENGKILPTPELIPFRLTQDIVDGFGVAGVEGPFRKYMEITLKVLRESKSVITTIVEVLKYDPLHQWTLNPRQIAKLQSSQPQLTNANSCSVSSAERALFRVQNKLNGLDEGVVLSVSEQVSKLIQQASDNHNLSQLFPGWQPYL